MLRAAKGFARFVFAIGAVVLAAQTIYTVRWELRYDRSTLTVRGYAVHAITLAVAAFFGAAFWTTRKRRGRSLIAVAACIANALLAGIPLAFVDRLPADFLLFNVALLAASLISIYAFLVPAPEAAASAAARPKTTRIAGDCTRPWFDHSYTVLFIAVILGNWGLWGRWASARGLHFSGFVSQLLAIVLAEIVTAAIHESGHALAALLFRMKLLGFSVGPFQWRRIEGRWTFSFHISGLAAVAGGVNVVPTRGDMPPDQDAWISVAGPLANFLSAPLLFWIAWRIPGSRLASAWLFFASLAGFAMIIGVFNLFPLRATGGSYSDGARLLQLLTRSPALELYRTERRIQSTLVTSTRIRDIDAADIARAADFFPGTAAAIRYHMCASNAHEDAGRIAEAAGSMAAAETIYNEYAIDLPAPLHTGFIIFHGMRNRDAFASRLWWDRMSAKKIERKNVDYWLAVAALAYVEGRAFDAETAWQAADSAARSLPLFGIYQLDRDRVVLLRSLLNGPMPEPVTPRSVAPPVRTTVTGLPLAGNPFDRRAALVTVAITLFLAAGFGTIRFRSYAAAIAWHHRHGDYAQLGSYRVKLPLSWREKDIGDLGHITLSRAEYSHADRDAEIVRAPAYAGGSVSSEPETLETMRNSVRMTNDWYASKGWVASLVVLKAKPFLLFCNRLDYSRPGETKFTEMACYRPNAAEAFTYTGPSSHEQEAESILSSMEPVASVR